MVVTINLKDFDYEILKLLAMSTRIQGLSVEEYAGAMLSTMLLQVWKRISEEGNILN